MIYDTDVLILGAGPVGLTLANELARFGVKPRIIDKGPSIREVSKAMILHTRTQEVLDRVGITRQVVEQSEPLREVVVHAYGKHIGSWDLDHLDSPHLHPVIIGQNRTQHLLLDHLALQGVAVEWNREAISFEQDVQGATTVVRGTDVLTTPPVERSIRSRYVVGCEGSNSIVRKGCHFTFEGDRYAGEQFIQADCRIQWALPKGRSYLFLTSDGYMMVIEFPRDVVRVFISLPDSKPIGPQDPVGASQLGAVEASDEEPTLEEIRHHLVRLSGYECELSEPTWLARYRTSHRYTNRFSLGRAFICGDAAHVHVPIGGQGMNTGIQDAFNLGWKLAGVVQGTLKPAILDTYHAERHPVAESLIRGTNFAYTGLLHPSQIKQHAARLFGPFLIGNEKVQGFMRNTLEELKVFYPNSPLNLDLGGARGPKPGERVLDVALVKAADHTTTSLVEVTRGATWTLLLFSGVEAGPPITDAIALAEIVGERYRDRVVPHVVLALGNRGSPIQKSISVLLDALHLAHERYGITGRTFYLLRPDTYVAARGPIGQQQALLDYLSTLFA
jgi:3-(3-hydroxy-phenyl)propionate hydroxylase